MFNKVFISYASEDIITAERFYNQLKNSGYEPWLAKKNLLPGQDWNTEIRLALKKADFIVMLLSKSSVAKRGYVQREFKLALEYCEERLESDIYIIPCKIDNCDLPDKLNKFQWVKLSNPESFELILTALNIQRKKYEEQERIKIASNTSYEFKEYQINKVVGDRPKNFIEIVYPQFVDTTKEDLTILNNLIENVIFNQYMGFINPFSTLYDDENEFNPEFPLSDNNLNISYKVELLSNHFISLTIFNYSYTGGAHGLYGTVGYTYRLNPLTEVAFERLLDSNIEALEIVSRLCKEKLLRKAKEEHGIEKAENFFLNEAGLSPTWDNFDNFYLAGNSFFIIFQVYQLTAYAYGQHEVEIEFEELLKIKPDLKTLRRVANELKE